MDREKKSLISLYSLNEEAPKGLAEKLPQVKKRAIADKDANGIKKVVTDLIVDRLGNGSFKLDLSMVKDPKERCDIVLKLMGFVLPKVSAIDVNGNLELDSVSDELNKLTQQTGVKLAATTKSNKEAS